MFFRSDKLWFRSACSIRNVACKKMAQSFIVVVTFGGKIGNYKNTCSAVKFWHPKHCSFLRFYFFPTPMQLLITVLGMSYTCLKSTIKKFGFWLTKKTWRHVNFTEKQFLVANLYRLKKHFNRKIFISHIIHTYEFTLVQLFFYEIALYSCRKSKLYICLCTTQHRKCNAPTMKRKIYQYGTPVVEKRSENFQCFFNSIQNISDNHSIDNIFFHLLDKCWSFHRNFKIVQTRHRAMFMRHCAGRSD